MKFLTFQEGPFLPPYNGVLIHLYTYLKRFSEEDNDVVIITNNRGEPNYTLYKQTPWTTVFLPVRDYYINKGLIKELLIEHRPDVVHATGAEHLLAILASITIELEIPLVFETFDITDTTALRRAMSAGQNFKVNFRDDAYQHNAYVRAAARVADGVICISEMTQNRLIGMEVPPDKIRVIPTSFAVSPLTYNFSNVASATILFIGNLYYLPNEMAARVLATHIFSKLIQHRPDAKLLIVGDGAPDLLEELRVYGATCPGSVDDLEPILRKTTLLVSPLSAGNEVKTKILLALSSGIPCITTTIGASGLQKTEGVLIEDDFDLYAERIAQLLSDHHRLYDMSKWGRLLIQSEYDPAERVQSLSTFLDEVIERTKSQLMTLRMQLYRAEISTIDLTHWQQSDFRPAWLEEEYKRGRYRGEASNDDMIVRVDKNGTRINHKGGR